jgi:hypothetical protein
MHAGTKVDPSFCGSSMVVTHESAKTVLFDHGIEPDFRIAVQR